MATVKLFGGLRAFTEQHALDVSGNTVGEALDKLCDDCVHLRQALFLDGGLLPHVRVMVNGRDIELDQGLATPVEPEDQIAVFPPIAGGHELESSYS